MTIETEEILAQCKKARALLKNIGGTPEEFLSGESNPIGVEPWEAEQAVRDTARGLYLVHDYEVRGDRPVGTMACGSARMVDTPRAMYRAFYLFRPTRISFANMYKGEFMTLVSPDYKFVASCGFYKYEMGVYFSAAEGHIQGRGSGILCGVPGSDNGIQPGSDAAREWFGLLVDMLNHEWEVYGGNNFEV